MNKDPYRQSKASKASETEAWQNMVDSIIDFLSASKTMLHILNDKLEAAKDENEDDVKKTVDEKIRQKFLNEFLHMDSKPDETVEEIHINKLFNEESNSNSKTTAFEKQLNEKYESLPKSRPASEFLDKQYNLTKRAIARRYQPQSKVPAPVAKGSNYLKRDFLTETFTEGLHRISNVASERVQMNRRGSYNEDHFRRPRVSVGTSSHEKTYVLYEKN